MVQPSSELSAVMRRLLVAFESRNEATIRALMSTSEQTLILGSDPREWYLGQDAVELIAFQAREMPPFRYEIHRVEAFEDGGLGWAAADVTADFASSTPIALRMSAVFRLEDGVWKAVHWNTSAPRPDDPEVVGAEISETMSKLLDSVETAVDLESLTKRLGTSTVTIMFTDLEDSTRRTAETGDEAWGRVITSHFRSLERIATEHDGVLVKTLGDGAMLAFGSARAAIRAALAITQSPTTPDSTRLRIGVNTGEAVRTNDDYFGQTVNIAARVTAAAEPGEILVSEVVRSLIGQSADAGFGEARSVEFKGVEGMQTVYPARAARPAAT